MKVDDLESEPRAYLHGRVVSELSSQNEMGINHSSTRDISALNKATIVDAAEILLAEKNPDSNKDDDDYEIALQGR